VKARTSIPGGHKTFSSVHVSEGQRSSFNDSVSTKVAILRVDDKLQDYFYGITEVMGRSNLFGDYFTFSISNSHSVDW
jgi:hypothetical protein